MLRGRCLVLREWSVPAEARDRRRILFLTCHLPFPPVSGGRRRDFELLRRLGRSFDVDLCVASKTYDEDVVNVLELEQVCSSVSLFPCEDPDPLPGSNLPMQIVRHRCRGLTEHMRRVVERDPPDLIHVEGFYLMQHVPTESRCPVLLVEQNVEYTLWRQRTETAKGDDRHASLKEYLLTLEAEIEAWKLATMCACLTEEDRNLMLEAVADLDVRIVPDGVDHLRAPSAVASEIRTPRGSSLVFVGNFGYQPNVDAALYLCNDILPLIRQRRPDVHLWLVGNAPPDEVIELQSQNIHVTGRVPQVEPYIHAADLAVYPLRIGGGIKVKVLEALSLGKAIVTTTVGAQGLPSGKASCMKIEDDPRRFARRVVELLEDPSAREALGERATRVADRLPTWNEAAERLASLYEEMIGARMRWRVLQS